MAKELVSVGTPELENEQKRRLGLRNVAYLYTLTGGIAGMADMVAATQPRLYESETILYGLGAIIFAPTIFQLFSWINNKSLEKVNTELGLRRGQLRFWDD